MFTTLILVMVSQVYAHVQNYQVVYINYVQFFVHQLYLNKAVKQKTKTSHYKWLTFNHI